MDESAVTPLTEEERRKLAELLDKATPGPWDAAGAIVMARPTADRPARSLTTAALTSDAELIVALRNLAPRLLASPEPMTGEDEYAIAEAAQYLNSDPPFDEPHLLAVAFDLLDICRRQRPAPAPMTPTLTRMEAETLTNFVDFVDRPTNDHDALLNDSCQVIQRILDHAEPPAPEPMTTTDEDGRRFRLERICGGEWSDDPNALYHIRPLEEDPDDA